MRRKAGFTLVELVVVIAILAILAAIAIPAVIGIINSTSNTALESEAATIDQSCKTYYEQIKTGMVTADRFKAEKSGDTIPTRGTSLTDKARLARRCTVGGALEYAGVYSDFVGRLDEFAYDSTGKIVAVTGDDAPEGCTKIAADGSTTFDDLNYTN